MLLSKPPMFFTDKMIRLYYDRDTSLLSSLPARRMCFTAYSTLYRQVQQLRLIVMIAVV